MEQMEEQRTFYMWAKRRGGANPDRAGLNRKRQRTGTETTVEMVFKVVTNYADYLLSEAGRLPRLGRITELWLTTSGGGRCYDCACMYQLLLWQRRPGNGTECVSLSI
jgi:hypothetical protein